MNKRTKNLPCATHMSTVFSKHYTPSTFLLNLNEVEFQHKHNNYLRSSHAPSLSCIRFFYWWQNDFFFMLSLRNLRLTILLESKSIFRHLCLPVFFTSCWFFFCFIFFSRHFFFIFILSIAHFEIIPWMKWTFRLTS